MHPTHTRPDIDADELTPADILRCAALYLSQRGWHQGDMFADATQPFPAACPQGAIRMAACGSPTTAYTIDTARRVDQAVAVLAGWLAWTYLDDYRPELTAIHHGDQITLSEVVGDWNDDQDRTATDVIAALSGAADDWDRIHGGVR